jgi:hypothetical protein
LKATIKVNNEIVDEEMFNLFNFTLKDNASNRCNNYVRNHPNCRFVDLKQVFYR